MDAISGTTLPGRDTPLELSLAGDRWQLRWTPPADLPAEAWLTGCCVAPSDGAAATENSGPATAHDVRLQQVHSANVVTVTGPGVFPACDAAVTARPDLTLIVRVADCVPVYLVGPGGIGLAHAGWRGTAGRIASRTVERLCAASGDAPAALAAFIGPSIGPCCFEVGPEVAGAFEPGFRLPAPRPRAGAPREHVDLWAANRAQLIETGLRPARIVTAALCTRCHQHLFHSYRGSAGQPGRLECALRKTAQRTAAARQRS